MSVTHKTEDHRKDALEYMVGGPLDPTFILKQRQEVYGSNNNLNMVCFGRMLRAILEMHYQQPLPGDIPAHVGNLIMVGIKNLRAAAPFKFEEDNYKDAHNYLELAKACDPRNAANEHTST